MSNIFNPLATPVSIANGGTNSSSALSNEEMIISHGGKIVENPNFTFDSADKYLSSSTQARAVVVNSVDESINNSSATDITWDTDVVNVSNVHSTVTNTNRLTVPTNGDGFYLVVIALAWAGSAAGTQRVASLYKNGATLLINAFASPSASYEPLCAGSVMVALAAGDYVNVQGFQDSGGALNCRPTSGKSQFSIVKLW